MSNQFYPGCYVTWSYVLRGKTYNRFGCVMTKPDKNGKVDIQASNARFPLSVALLSVADVEDAIVADQKAIYG